MEDILKHTGSNIGGVNPVQYAAVEDISSITRNEETLITTVTLKSGKSWSYLYASPDSILVESTEEDTDAGTKYTYNIKMMVPKDRSGVEATLRQMNGRGFIVKVHDKNGVVRYFGEIGNPMRKSSKLLKPATVDSFNGWEVAFSGEFSRPAGYNATGDLVPEGPPFD